MAFIAQKGAASRGNRRQTQRAEEVTPVGSFSESFRVSSLAAHQGHRNSARDAKAGKTQNTAQDASTSTPDWSIIFPGRSSVAAPTLSHSSASALVATTTESRATTAGDGLDEKADVSNLADEQRRSVDESAEAGASGLTLTMPAWHEDTGRFLSRRTVAPAFDADDEADLEDEPDLNTTATQSGAARAARSEQWMLESLDSPSIFGSEHPSIFVEESRAELYGSIALPSESSASNVARGSGGKSAAGSRTEGDGYASDLHFPEVPDRSAPGKSAPRGASQEAVWSWAAVQRGTSLLRSASETHLTSSEDEVDDFHDMTASQLQLKRDNDASDAHFDALLDATPAAQSAGIGSKPFKRRHRKAGGSERSKRSATETSRSASVARMRDARPRRPATRRNASSRRAAHASSAKHTEAASQSVGKRLLRKVFSRLFSADAELLDALLNDSGPLAVDQGEVEHFENLRMSSRYARGTDRQAFELDLESLPRRPPRMRMLLDGREVEDLTEEEDEGDDEEEGKAAERPASEHKIFPQRPLAPSSAALATALELARRRRSSSVASGSPLSREPEPTTLEALQAALIHNGILRVPTPLRILGELARALQDAVWGEAVVNDSLSNVDTRELEEALKQRKGSTLLHDSEDEQDGDVAHYAHERTGSDGALAGDSGTRLSARRLSLGHGLQTVPRAWNGNVHPSLRGRSTFAIEQGAPAIEG
ncbi:hypothetical protein IE81DRAFT_347071 [Ceraceosorus guamensis]|uniref:Uncharacterized protein n=1 Tax=Ceraceosorus guamensis TaxID=1522189 RepID=A0A316W5H0_9BASI|nr:hypothetical protein IE81DRAFT_347071 [Ceraceosorus guamensis]PWN42895.1 hypothetical protein IE81DRAFT_347071 [Ceraceosorus guamensis]